MVVNSPRAIFVFFFPGPGDGVWKKAKALNMYEFESKTCPGYQSRAPPPTAAIMLHIYFDLRTYALGRLVKRLLGARASQRQWPHLHRVFRFTPSLSLSLSPAWNLILSPFNFRLSSRRQTHTHTHVDICYYVVITPSMIRTKQQ